MKPKERQQSPGVLKNIFERQEINFSVDSLY
jgi:hypothetical protein